MDKKELAVQTILANLSVEVSNYRIALEMANLRIKELEEENIKLKEAKDDA